MWFDKLTTNGNDVGVSLTARPEPVEGRTFLHKS